MLPISSRPKRVAVNGWFILDKPVNMTSTFAVGRVKHLLNAKKAGHAGTLDPLASGLLPIALGEATKTVPFVQDGVKEYRFTVQWGAQTDTDDSEGRVIHTSDLRPTSDQIQALLPQFVGKILQTPPIFSALKIKGERAYDKAREGEEVILAPRPVTIYRLDLVNMTRESAVFETKCGKGTYVRAIARDLGNLLGCYGHVTALRRTRVGPFGEAQAISLDTLETGDRMAALLPIQSALTSLPCVQVDRNMAARLRKGQSLILRGENAPSAGMIYVMCQDVPVVFGPVEEGALIPSRVFHV